MQYMLIGLNLGVLWLLCSFVMQFRVLITRRIVLCFIQFSCNCSHTSICILQSILIHLVASCTFATSESAPLLQLNQHLHLSSTLMSILDLLAPLRQFDRHLLFSPFLSSVHFRNWPFDPTSLLPRTFRAQYRTSPAFWQSRELPQGILSNPVLCLRWTRLG